MMRNLSRLREADLRSVLADYPYDIVRIWQITGGFVNQTFGVETPSGRLVVRECIAEKKRAELDFEISVLRYLEKKHFKLTAHVIRNKNGNFITRKHGKFYVVQSYLPGEVKATWYDLKEMTLPRLLNLCVASAKFSKQMAGFHLTAKKNPPTVGFYAANASRRLDEIIQAMPESAGKALLKSYRPALNDFFQETINLLRESGYDRQPQQIVHFDLQPGNFHFMHNEVVGLFDFDWVRRDHRLVDLAAVICQSCYYDRGVKAGIYRRDRARKAVSTYRKAWGKSNLSVPSEMKLLVAIQRAYNTFQFLFTAEWYGKNSHAPRAKAILSLFVNMLLKNDYNDLFGAV